MENNLMEEIIVNGIDVSRCYGKTPYKNDYGQVECKCFRFLSDDNETYLLDICEQHPDCHYKQLKRKEKECEELKKEMIQGNQFYSDRIDALSEVNREFQEKINKFRWDNPYYELYLNANNRANLAEEKLCGLKQEIQEVLEPIKCTHPETCWMNRDEGSGDILGCEPDDVKTITDCPSKVATCILNIIEREK